VGTSSRRSPSRFAGEDDGDRCGCCLGRQRQRGISNRRDHRDRVVNQFGGQHRQSIHFVLGPAVFDRDVLTLDIAGILEALAKYAQTIGVHVRRCGAEESDHRHRQLRLRNEGQRSRATEKRDELAPLHSITSSANK
jgi:hypothetical protein